MGNLRRWKRKNGRLQGRILIDPPEETSWLEHLSASGFEIRDPESLDIGELRAGLWELIEILFEEKVVLDHTDHLSDRQLYELLWNDVLREPHEPVFEGGICSIVSCVDRGQDLDYLRYYADEKTRNEYADDPWQGELPPAEPCRFDRDRHLPVPPGKEDFFGRAPDPGRAAAKWPPRKGLA